MKSPELDIGILAPKTCFSAVRPFAVSVALAAAILCLSNACKREAPDRSTPRKIVQAYGDALERNDLPAARKLAIGSEEKLNASKLLVDYDVAFARLEIAEAEKFEGETKRKELAEKNSQKRWARANEVIEQNKATVSTGWLGPSFKLEKDTEGWKIDLDHSSGGIAVAAELRAGKQGLDELSELTERVRKGYYKNKDEAEQDLNAKLARWKTSDPSPSSTQSMAANPQPSASPTVANQPAVVSTSTPRDKLPEYTAAEAANHIGENATVIGRVDCVECVTGCYVSFGDCGGDATFFVHLPKDPPGPELDVDKLKGVTIAVSGKIGGSTKHPSILAQSTSQIALPKQSTSGELERTIAQKGKALEANPRDATAYYQRGMAEEKKAALHQSVNDYRAAIDDYNQCVKLDPSNSDALVHIGDCYAAQQDYQAAKQAWDKAIEVSPQAKELLKDSIAKEKGRYIYAAIHDLDKLIAMAPKNPALYYREAELYVMDGNADNANLNFRRAAELEPTNVTYADKASHPVAPAKRQLTVEEMKDAFIDGIEKFGTKALGVAALSDIQRHEHVKQLIENSGGTKIECPECHGRGYIFPPIDDRNPYSRGTEAWKTYEDLIDRETSQRFPVTCPKCKGARVVDK